MQRKIQLHPENGPARDNVELEAIRDALSRVRSSVLARDSAIKENVAGVPVENRASVANLVHYLALRSQDLRSVQRVLDRLGLSSLTGVESHVMDNIDAALRILDEATEEIPAPAAQPANWLTRAEARGVLRERTEALLGPARAGRSVRIMVTLPAEAAQDYQLVRDLVAKGMNCARINCAHDDSTTWKGMIESVRRAEAELGTPCRILMDLPGPRIRTGPLEPGPEVLKVHPPTDELGWVMRPAEVWLTATEHPQTPPSAADATLCLPAQFLEELSVGDCLRLRDTRGARRKLTITSAVGGSRGAQLNKTTYFATGTRVVRTRRQRQMPAGSFGVAAIGPIAPLEQALRLRPGDALVLTRSQEPGRPATTDGTGRVLSPAQITCTTPEALDWVKPGERIWFDDGRIGGVITSVRSGQVVVTITTGRSSGERLKAGKGINLPDTDLRFPPLTTEDLQDLRFIVQHADLIGYSFVRTSSDVAELQRQLEKAGGGDLGLIIKVETRAAYEDLPDILLTALRSRAAGVMIARGDLAVECGFEHLAEIQEEIVWMCEAAHLPVIWATQVLEQLAKQGLPTRAEITDAAAADRAECVMLNKGPFISEAVRLLDNILERTETHQEKNRSMLGPIGIAERFFAEESGSRPVMAIRGRPNVRSMPSSSGEDNDGGRQRGAFKLV
jgi:pyruvate kinase